MGESHERKMLTVGENEEGQTSKKGSGKYTEWTEMLGNNEI